MRRILTEESVVIKAGASRTSKKYCDGALLKKRLPITAWLPEYSISKLGQDCLAGITVGLTAIPQSIAYAVVAGLPPQYGLYSSFMGCFVYIILGGCKDITIGPTAIMALMVQPHVSNRGPDFAILLCFLTGCVIFLMGILHLGFLVDFISVPVTAGFTTASAITIAFSQLKSLFGVGGKATAFLDSLINFIKRIKHVQLWDSVLGVSSILILLFFRYLKRFGYRQSRPNRTATQNFMAKSYWLISLASNAIVVVAGTFLAWALSTYGYQPFTLTQEVEQGMPPFKPPPFSTVHNNETYSFIEMIQELQTSIISIPIIAILESVAIAKAFAGGRSIDATQEMLALGMCNIMGSFVSSMPTTGSFTRTAVNNASGVRTPLGGAFTGGLVILALSLLASAFYFIPKPTLSAVIITAMFFMLDIDTAILLWKTKKSDLVIFIITVLGCLFVNLEVGIIIGVGFNAFYILYWAARPPLAVEQLEISGKEVLLATPSQNIQYPAAETLRESIIAKAGNNGDIILVLDGSNLHHIDVTVAKNISVLADDLKRQSRRLILWKWPKNAQDMCTGADSKLGPLFTDVSSIEDILNEDTPHEQIVTVEINNI